MLKWLFRLFLLFTIVALVFAIVARFAVPPMVSGFVDGKLKEAFGEEAGFGGVDLSLHKGRVVLKDLRVPQPEGWGEGDLLRFSSVEADIAVGALLGGNLVIEKVRLVDPFAGIALNPEGRSNIEAAMVKLGFEVEVADEEDGADEPDSDGERGGGSIRIVSVEIVNGGFSFADANLAAPLSASLEGLMVDLADLSLDPSALELGSLVISGARIFVERGKPADDLPEATEDAAGSDQPASEEESVELAAEETSSDAKAGRIVVHEFRIEDVELTYRDAVLMEEVLQYVVVPFGVAVSGLVIDGANPVDGPPGEVRISFGLNQGEGVQTAAFDLRAQLSDFDRAYPTVAAWVRISGLDLEPIRPLLPTGTIAALGGSGIDFETNLRMSDEQLDGTFAVINNKGGDIRYPITGTPAEPDVVSINAIFTNLLGRPVDMAANIAGGAIDAASEIGSGAVRAAGDLAEGAGNVVSRVGGGVLSGARGLLRGDLEEAGEGLSEATIGAVSGAGSAAADAVSEARDSAGSAGRAASGGAKVDAWRAGTAERHAASVDAAEAWLAEQTGAESSGPAPGADGES